MWFYLFIIICIHKSYAFYLYLYVNITYIFIIHHKPYHYKYISSNGASWIKTCFTYKKHRHMQYCHFFATGVTYDNKPKSITRDLFYYKKNWRLLYFIIIIEEDQIITVRFYINTQRTFVFTIIIYYIIVKYN